MKTKYAKDVQHQIVSTCDRIRQRKSNYKKYPMHLCSLLNANTLGIPHFVNSPPHTCTRTSDECGLWSVQVQVQDKPQVAQTENEGLLQLQLQLIKL